MEMNKDNSILNDKNEYARWNYSNNQKYLEVSANNHYHLGLLQGEFLSKKIYNFQALIKKLLIRYYRKRYAYNRLKNVAEIYEKNIPNHLKLEMQGMADALQDINYRDILLQNCFLDLLYGHLIPNDLYNLILHYYNIGCTSFGAVNNKSTIIGQNFDLAIPFKSSLSFVLIKMPDKPKIFTLRLGSLLSLPVGINSYGIVVNINVVKTRIKGKFSIPVSIRTRIALELSKSAESFYTFYIQTPLNASFNLLISDNSKIIATENIPNKHNRVDVKNTIVKSNTFISNPYQQFLIKKKYSKRRQRYAESLLNSQYKKYKSNITDKILLNILADEPIICRLKPYKPMTLAFLTKNHFGRGNAKYFNHGNIPINN